MLEVATMEVMTRQTEATRLAAFQTYIAGLKLTNYDRVHLKRYKETLERMDDILRSRQSIVELGGLSLLAGFLKVHDNSDVSDYAQELRRPLALPSEAFDIVLMLEVLEHLNDLPPPDARIEEVAQFTGSGVKACLAEVFRILRFGGFLVLTTPNASSVDTLGNVLLKKDVFQYPPHVREYPPSVVIDVANKAGFSLYRFSTFFAWNPRPGIDRPRLLKAIGDLGFDPADRGDDAFFVFMKAGKV